MSARGKHDKAQIQARFSGLISDCRVIAVQHLNVLFSNVFDSVESTMMEFADKAESNTMQKNFFEAIQEINRSQENIKRAFDGEIKIGFVQFSKGRPLAVAGGAERTEKTVRPPSTTGFDTGNLQLLDKLAHAESAVIQTLAAKTTHRYREALYALNQRLAIVNGGHQLEEIAVPAGPSHILYAFGASIRALHIESNVRLILFALFDRVVMSHLESLYEDINRCLMNAGVLPDLKPSVNKHADSGEGKTSTHKKTPPTAAADTATSAPAGGDSDASASMGDQLFGTIRNLLATHRRATQASTAAAQPGAKAEQVAPYPDSTVLVSVINKLQVEQIEADSTSYTALISDDRIDKGTLETIRQNLRAERNRIYEGLDRRRIPQIDIDVIDIVGMLFDCILNDENLPDVVKAWLSRLHTPYLKIAVLEKNVLTSEQHSARLLLNKMVDAGEKWVFEDKPREGILPQIKYVVNRILRGFRDESKLFDELLQEFTDAVDALKQKSALIEQRAREAAAGQEKLRKAKEVAHKELATRSHGKAIPLIARKFLTEIWADNLTLILLRSNDAEQSKEWAEALRIADEVIWSVTPKTTAGDREQLSKRLPELQRTIEEELGSLGGYGRNEQEDLLGLLKELQQNALQTIAEQMRDTAATTQLLTPPHTSETEDNALTAESAAIEHERAAVEPGAIVVEDGLVSVESEPIAVEPESVAVELETIPAEEQAIINELRSIKVGTLYDFRYSDAGNTRRLKLSWCNQDKTIFMFVNQAGVKMAEYSIRELASAVLAGDAHWVDSRKKPFFEGALESIRRILSSTPDPRT